MAPSTAPESGESPGGASPGGASFFGCYLLASLNPAMKGRSYVGFTVNPPRRIRQHNGALSAGAKKTRKLRPCEMLVVVHGFLSDVQALQFEWAWQNPRTSAKVRATATRLKISDRSSSPANKIKLLMGMLHLSPWRHLPLTVHWLSPEHRAMAEKTCERPPGHVKMESGTMAELKARMGERFRDDDDDVFEGAGGGGGGARSASESASVSLSLSLSLARGGGGEGCGRRCGICGETLLSRRGGDRGDRDGRERKRRRVGCGECGVLAHPSCMASRFFQLAAKEAADDEESGEAVAAAFAPRTLLPPRGRCPACDVALTWGDVVAAAAAAAAREERERERERARVASWANGTRWNDLDDTDDDDDDDDDDERATASTPPVDENDAPPPLAARLAKRAAAAAGAGASGSGGGRTRPGASARDPISLSISPS
jgi:structure-specific endonuclease subunit SLX1